MNKNRLKYHLLRLRKQNLLLLLSVALVSGVTAFLFFKSILLTLLFLSTPFFFAKFYKISKHVTLRAIAAKELGRERFSKIYEMVDLLAIKAELNYVPSLYLIPSDLPNSMAIGDSHESGIGISYGLINHLNTFELYGVLAHEISHIKNQDYKTLKLLHISYAMVSLLSFFVNILVLLSLPLVLMGKVSIGLPILLAALFAPNFIQLLILGLMRNYEYNADLTASQLTGDPLYLASALLKINEFQRSRLKNFLIHRVDDETHWLDTHPSSLSRVRRLYKLSK